MAYIGKNLVGMLKEVKTVNTMTGDGSDTTLTLSDTPGSVNNVLLFIDGIKQTPETDYNVIGNALTFSTAPAAGTSVVAVVGNHSGIEPTDFSITSKHIVDGTVTDAKIATGISSSKLSGAFPALDGSALTGIPAGIVPLFKSASDPTVTSNKPLGQIWSNSTTGEMYVCTDATVGANVWYNIGDGSGNVPGPIVATGGTVTTDGEFKVHTFTTSGAFVVTSGMGTLDYLVVAGGGGTICWNAGGGGAGGLRSTMTNTGGGASLETALSGSVQSYTVTVGAGGAGAATNVSDDQTSGEDSVFGPITSLGGGLARYTPAPAPTGGSGAGGAFRDGVNVSAFGSGTAGQGYDGAEGNGSPPYSSGGGGAGAVGGVPSGGANGGFSGSGGVGVAVAISGSSIFYAGGGAGGGATNAGGTWNPGTGGNGGGGSGSQQAPNAANNGTANTGGGGGASGRATNTFFASGAGGSGIVIIRYQFQ